MKEVAPLESDFSVGKRCSYCPVSDGAVTSRTLLRRVFLLALQYSKARILCKHLDSEVHALEQSCTWAAKEICIVTAL